MKAYYLLMVNISKPYDTEALKEKINLALDWVQIVPGVFIVESTSDLEKWYGRLKPILKDNDFFLIKITLDGYTGWLHQWVWDWIKEKQDKNGKH